MQRYGSRFKPGLHISHKDASTAFEHVFLSVPEMVWSSYRCNDDKN